MKIRIKVKNTWVLWLLWKYCTIFVLRDVHTYCSPLKKGHNIQGTCSSIQFYDAYMIVNRKTYCTSASYSICNSTTWTRAPDISLCLYLIGLWVTMTSAWPRLLSSPQWPAFQLSPACCWRQRPPPWLLLLSSVSTGQCIVQVVVIALTLLSTNNILV